MPKKHREPPKVGKVFERIYKGKTYRMTVVEFDGKTRFKVGNQVFATPTAAAKSVVGEGRFISGPLFWQMDEAS
jgi:hypothetical protein